MNRGQKFFAFLGRVLISAIFLLSGVNKVMDWQGSETLITNLICDLHAGIMNYPMIETVLENLLPYNTIILIIVVVLELVGGLLVFFGWRVRTGAVLLALFLIPTTLLVHRFWVFQGPERELEMIMVLKNAAILGGLLTLAVFGTGNSSESNSKGFKGGSPFGKDS
jgi:putative oxidoreductase